MGKGLDTCLMVKTLTKSSAEPLQIDITERKKKLLLLTPLNVQPQSQGSGLLARQVRGQAMLSLRSVCLTLAL